MATADGERAAVRSGSPFEALMAQVGPPEVELEPGGTEEHVVRWDVYSRALAAGRYAGVLRALADEPDAFLARAVAWELVERPEHRTAAIDALVPGPHRDEVVRHAADAGLRDLVVEGGELSDVPVADMSAWLQAQCIASTSSEAFLTRLAQEGTRRNRHAARERLRQVTGETGRQQGSTSWVVRGVGAAIGPGWDGAPEVRG